MNPESGIKEPRPSEWLELANGGGVMFRDSTSAPQPQPQNYARQRRLKQLPTGDATERRRAP